MLLYLTIIYLIIGIIISYWACFIQPWGRYVFNMVNFVLTIIFWLPISIIWIWKFWIWKLVKK